MNEKVCTIQTPLLYKDLWRIFKQQLCSIELKIWKHNNIQKCYIKFKDSFCAFKKIKNLVWSALNRNYVIFNNFKSFCFWA